MPGVNDERDINHTSCKSFFQTNENAEKLSTMDAMLFHHLVAKLLYFGKRTRLDLLTTVSFLCIRIQSPDVDDFKKLGWCLRYLRDSRHLSVTLEADAMNVIQWWVDASFATHPNCRSHTGATLSFGKGSVYLMSSKQKLNTRSSTEAELVGINDVLSMILWTQLFLEAQGYKLLSIYCIKIMKVRSSWLEMADVPAANRPNILKCDTILSLIT